MPPDVTRNQPRAQVVIPARRGGDDHADGLAVVEVGDRIGRNG
jgi:hypothetical protein